MVTKRTILLGLAGCALAVMASPAAAQSYPQQPVRLVVGAAPGGSVDTAARIIAEGLSKMWPQPVVVENRPGASNAVSAELVANSAPDGYTLLMVNNNHTSANLGEVRYDPIEDFTPLVLGFVSPNILVTNKNVPANTLAEFVAYAAANPGELNFGTPGDTSPNYANVVALMEATGIELEHITYAGMGPAMAALMGDEIQFASSSASAALSAIQEGTIKALAVTSSSRYPVLPDVQTVNEAVGIQGYDRVTWTGIVAPAGLPAAVAEKLATDIRAVLATPEALEQMSKVGLSSEHDVRTPEAFGAYMAARYAEARALNNK